MTSSSDLLRQFARERSQDAFAEIVRRHLNLVYSAALRQVRLPQLAEEIAQSVFADLARNAGKLKSDTILTAWLYAVTRRTAIDVVRKESRRRLREQIAVEMNTMNATSADWTQVEPLLDDAMAALDETDRSAVLLRYFENKSLREVGGVLGASEDAAQKRVRRAVERLREFFTKRNVTIGASGLAILISANAVQSAPVGLAAAISTAAIVTGTTVSTSTAIAATKTIVMTALQKTIIGAVLIVAVGTGAYEAHQAARLSEQNKALRQKQAALAEHIRQLQRERDDASNQLAGMLAANAQRQSNSDETELLELRNKVTQLENEENDPTEIAARPLVIKIKLLKQRLEQTPQWNIPELQFATERDWLTAALTTRQLNKESDYRRDFEDLLSFVEYDFGIKGMAALQHYMLANKGQFPTDLSELEPYFNPPVDSAILQRYEIVPASAIPAAKNLGAGWLIAEKAPVIDKYEGREVFGSKGFGNSQTYW